MSDPEEEDQLPFQRSSIAAIGQRRGWSLFRRKHEDEEPEFIPDPPSERPVDEGPRSMLGSLASQKGPDPAPEPERRSRSVLSLDRPGPAEPGDDALLVGPLVAHSSLAEIAGIEERRSSPFPIERGILISLVAHLALLVLLLVAPARIPAGSKGDLFAALQPPEKDDSPIPVIFQDAPGKAQPNPKRSPLSDADRRAGGGDPAKPKADTPFIRPSQGVAGLAPGPKAPRVPGSEVPSRKGTESDAERRAAAAQPQTSDTKPSEFPSPAQAQQRSSGPREISKLAGLDSAIREAARGTVGGEGGAPQGNPEGGFVDSGPVSFDTTWYDWGPYAAEMIRRIKLHWDVPELARLGWKGSLTVRYFILADGTVADAKIIRASGIPPFDFAAFQAIIKSSPFRPLPADLNSKREGVTVTFFYNMRPEAEEAEAK